MCKDTRFEPANGKTLFPDGNSIIVKDNIFIVALFHLFKTFTDLIFEASLFAQVCHINRGRWWYNMVVWWYCKNELGCSWFKLQQL